MSEGKIITFHTKRISGIPCVGIGTFNRTREELVQVLGNYPFQNLLIDTAAKYDNESEVGISLKELGLKRANIYVVAKISYQQQCYNNARKALNETLTKLQINYVDLYLIHSPRNKNTINTWKQMIRLREEGLALEIGVSNFTIEQIEQLYWSTGEYPSTNQIVSSTMSNVIKSDIADYCKANNILLQDAQPFSGSKGKLKKENYNNILLSNFERRFVSIFGTRNVSHLIENINPFLEKDIKS